MRPCPRPGLTTTTNALLRLTPPRRLQQGPGNGSAARGALAKRLDPGCGRPRFDLKLTVNGAHKPKNPLFGRVCRKFTSGRAAAR